MSYERDPDRATRGPGAIAALDRPGGRRDQRRIRGAQATIARDRAMSRVTMGALGRIDDTSTKVGATTTRSGASGGSGITPAPVYRPPPPPPLPLGPVMTTFPTPVLPPALPLSTMKPPVLSPGESPPIIAPPVPIYTILDPPPVSLPPVLLPPLPAPAKTSGGMSSGAGTVMTTGGMSPPIYVDPGSGVALPDVPDTTTDHSTRNLLLLGGGALALYFLLRKKRGAP